MELGIERLLLWFFVETGSSGFFETHTGVLTAMILGAGLGMCFFGVKVYRGAWSALVFISVTLGFTLWLRGEASWGTIVTAFTVIGMMLSVLAFHWKRIAAYTMSGILAGSTVMFLSGSYLAGILTGILIFFLALFQPFSILAAATALWGAMTAAVTAVRLFDFPWNPEAAVWIIAAILFAGGLALQLLVLPRDSTLHGTGPLSSRFIRKKRES